MAGTQNTYLLLWITGAYLFCGGNRVLAHDGSTHTDVSIEHHQEISDLFQKLPHKNDTKNLMQWKDVIEMRYIHYTKWRMEERVHSYTAKKRVPHTEQRSKKYTIMVPEKRTEIVRYATTQDFQESPLQEYRVRVPFQEEFEKQYTVMIPVKQERTTSWTVKVPYTETFEKMYTVMVPVEERKSEERTIKVPFMERIDETYTVRIPYQEKNNCLSEDHKTDTNKNNKKCHLPWWALENRGKGSISK